MIFVFYPGLSAVRELNQKTLHKLGTCLLLPICFLIGTSKPGLSADLAIPDLEGRVLLTIDGDISNHNVGETLQFDLAMLESFTPVTFTTETIWFDEATTFTGVSLSELLEYAGANSEKIRADALDKYWYEFKNNSWKDVPVIVAYKKNGSYMRIKELGPLWIMYPFDDYPDTLTEDNQGACVWQLIRLSVL